MRDVEKVYEIMQTNNSLLFLLNRLVTEAPDQETS